MSTDTTYPSSRGGKREGAGRLPGLSNKERAAVESGELDLDSPLVTEATRLSIRRGRAVADKAEADAKNADLKFKVDSKEYLPRTAFREAAATLLAELAQGLRSLPDELERKHSLAPEIVQAVEETINDHLSEIANGLEMFTGVEE